MAHPVVEYTSEASWAMVLIFVRSSFPCAHVCSDRGQILAICQRNFGKPHCVSRSTQTGLHTETYAEQTSKEEVLPATKLARAQLPTDPDKRWKTVIPVVEELKAKAKKLGLWNLFLSKAHYPDHGVPLTNLEVGVHFWTRLHLSDYCKSDSTL
jgi:hypothetical protein